MLNPFFDNHGPFEILNLLEVLNINNKKLYNTTLDDINKLYNKIRAEQVKIKIKVKIQSKGILIGHVY